MNRSLTKQAPAHNVRVNGFIAQMDRAQRDALARELERQDVAEIERAGIARRIKQAREEAGLSQPEMAEALGTHERTYQNYESVSKPRTPWSLMGDIAKVTGKSSEWLIHGDKMTPDLLGSVGEVDNHIERMADEFRRYVDEMLTLLRDAQSEREAIRKLLETQESILEDMQRVAKGLPGDEALELVSKAAQTVLERGEAAAESRGEASGTAPEIRRQGA